MCILRRASPAVGQFAHLVNALRVGLNIIDADVQAILCESHSNSFASVFGGQSAFRKFLGNLSTNMPRLETVMNAVRCSAACL